jgi:hypothetical protein
MKKVLMPLYMQLPWGYDPGQWQTNLVQTLWSPYFLTLTPNKVLFENKDVIYIISLAVCLDQDKKELPC